MEETAVASLGNDIVALAESELGNDFRALGARYRVVAPEFELVVDALEMSVVAEDDRYVLLSCAVEQFCGLGDYCKTSVALECAGDEVVEHINDKNCVLLFHNIYSSLCVMIKLYRFNFPVSMTINTKKTLFYNRCLCDIIYSYQFPGKRRVLMATVLLTVIFIAYIGLGISDSYPGY